jgi:hypothetical protein
VLAINIQARLITYFPSAFLTSLPEEIRSWANYCLVNFIFLLSASDNKVRVFRRFEKTAAYVL